MAACLICNVLGIKLPLKRRKDGEMNVPTLDLIHCKIRSKFRSRNAVFRHLSCRSVYEYIDVY